MHLLSPLPLPPVVFVPCRWHKVLSVVWLCIRDAADAFLKAAAQVLTDGKGEEAASDDPPVRDNSVHIASQGYIGGYILGRIAKPTTAYPSTHGADARSFAKAMTRAKTDPGRHSG